MISDKNMKKMRATQELNLPETAYLQARSYLDDGMGGKVEGPMETIKQCKARLGEPNGKLEQEQAGRINAKVVAVITLPADVTLDGVDEIQINGKQWKAHWSNADKSNMTALRVIVSEVKN